MFSPKVSLASAISAAFTSTNVWEAKCPFNKRKECKRDPNDKLHELPDVVSKNLACVFAQREQYAIAILAETTKADNGVSLTAREEADAVEAILSDYLRTLRNEHRGFRYSFHHDWKYAVHRPR